MTVAWPTCAKGLRGADRAVGVVFTGRPALGGRAGAGLGLAARVPGAAGGWSWGAVTPCRA